MTPDITLRDFYAAHALAGFIAGRGREADDAAPPSVVAASAFVAADAMLAERDQEAQQAA